MIEFEAPIPKRKHLDLTPLVDVIFQLLLFFVLTSVWTNGITLDIPDAESAEPSSRTTVTLSVDAEGTTFLNAQPVDMAGIRESLRLEMARHDDPVLAIEADVASRYGAFVQLVDVCRALGIEDVVLITDRAEKE